MDLVLICPLPMSCQMFVPKKGIISLSGTSAAPSPVGQVVVEVEEEEKKAKKQLSKRINYLGKRFVLLEEEKTSFFDKWLVRLCGRRNFSSSSSSIVFWCPSSGWTHSPTNPTIMAGSGGEGGRVRKESKFWRGRRPCPRHRRPPSSSCSPSRRPCLC